MSDGVSQPSLGFRYRRRLKMPRESAQAPLIQPSAIPPLHRLRLEVEAERQRRSVHDSRRDISRLRQLSGPAWSANVWKREAELARRGNVRIAAEATEPAHRPGRIAAEESEGPSSSANVWRKRTASAHPPTTLDPLPGRPLRYFICASVSAGLALTARLVSVLSPPTLRRRCTRPPQSTQLVHLLLNIRFRLLELPSSV
ncbi:hypothetical protein B0H14DRAFT_225229 [Mycena olivaceomarginata]|nr:hypothetical protein B0H14DRAFT_225229 [Mycena olivaceomarginata]